MSVRPEGEAAGRPLLVADPGATYRRHAAAVDAAIRRALESGSYILGPEVGRFEEEFAVYQGGGYAVGVGNGTDALELALRAAGIGPGSIVATVANTVTATVSAIVEAGARPRFVEIDPRTMTMDPDALEAALAEGGVGAVLPVHLYGQPADLPRICSVAARFGAVVIEDCAQAHGATVGGRKVGTWGGLAGFSFYPTKNLGGFGDGGLVWSREPEAAERVRALRQYGWNPRYVAQTPGRNSRLDELQAAILRALLPVLEAENERRRQIAARYFDALQLPGLRLPPRDSGAVYHQFAIRTRQRDQLVAHLRAAGVYAAVLYPVPVHRQPAYAQPKLVLPETERACAEVMSLPVHPGLSDADVDRVIAAVQSWRSA